MATVPDFKLANGEWAKELRNGMTPRSYTRAVKYYWGMMSRVAPGGSQQIKRPLYANASCTFVDFQEFAEWCQDQIGYTSGFQLDKDLLVKGSKVYSKDTCVFIPQQLNTLLIKRDRGRGEFPLGVCRAGNQFMAQCSVGVGRQEYLGVFGTPESAFAAYKVFKEDYIKQQANKWRSQIDVRAYEALMSYEVLITD